MPFERIRSASLHVWIPAGLLGPDGCYYIGAGLHRLIDSIEREAAVADYRYDPREEEVN